MATVPAPGSNRDAWWRRWGIRRQLTLVATLSVLLPLLIGIFVLANLLHERLTTTLMSSILDENARLTSLVQNFGPSVVGDPDQVSDGFEAQIIDSLGHVVATWSRTSQRPLTTARPDVGVIVKEGVSPVWWPGMDDGQMLLVASGVSHHDSYFVVVVASSHHSQHEAVNTVVLLLLATIPLVAAAVAVAANLLIKRALSPVATMSERVDTISSHNLSERVVDPGRMDEIGVLATTMNRMLERLDASQKIQRRFVADASHELRSPLSTLRGAIELGESATDERTWNELAPLMRVEADRLAALINDLLVLSRSDDRGLLLVTTEVDLDDLVDAETRRLRDSGTLQVRCDIRATRVLGDRDMLLRALRNLDDNALRHARGVIALSVAPTVDGGARIEVADDGHGIGEADRQRVLERFVRLDESRSRDSGGSGLGLAIVDEVVHAHGGTLTVGESSLGGASFVIFLPASPPGRTVGR